jgi:hypothetical protein
MKIKIGSAQKPMIVKRRESLIAVSSSAADPLLLASKLIISKQRQILWIKQAHFQPRFFLTPHYRAAIVSIAIENIRLEPCGRIRE